MRLVRIGLGSINTTVGAFRANADKVIAMAAEMAADDVTVGVFPEQAIGGYPAEDLIQWQGFVERQWPELERFAPQTATLATVFIVGVAVLHDGLRYNCAARGGRPDRGADAQGEAAHLQHLLRRAHAVARACRSRRSTVGVPFGDVIFQLRLRHAGAEVCEDLWSPDGPMRRRTYSGAELVCNLSASPFRLGVVQTRRELIATRASDHQCTIAYANVVGANDGLIFDGGGFVNQNGKWMLEAPRFQEGFAAATVDLDRTSRLRAENTTWRDDAEEYLADHTPVADGGGARTTSSAPSTRARRCATRCRATAASSSPTPRRGAPSASCSARTSSTRWRWASATTSRRTGPSR